MISKVNLKYNFIFYVVLNELYSFFSKTYWNLLYFLIWWNKELFKINFKVFFKKFFNFYYFYSSFKKIFNLKLFFLNKNFLFDHFTDNYYNFLNFYSFKFLN